MTEHTPEQIDFDAVMAEHEQHIAGPGGSLPCAKLAKHRRRREDEHCLTYRIAKAASDLAGKVARVEDLTESHVSYVAVRDLRTALTSQPEQVQP